MTHNTSVIPLTELRSRLDKLQKALAAKKLDAALIVQNTDLFYFSGTAQQGWLYVPVTGEPLLMIFKDYDRARAESPLEHVMSIVSPKKIPQLLAEMDSPSIATLGLELDVLPVNLYKQYSGIFTEVEFVDISLEIRLIRAVKSDYEIAIIRQACMLSDTVAAKVPELLSEGKTEVTLAGEIEGYARSLGHQGIVRMRMWGGELFYGHLMCGASATVASYLASPTGGEGVNACIGQGASYNMLARNEPILVDYVFAYEGYISDHTRIFAMGDLPDELMKAHEAMLELQEKVRTLAKPGVLSGEIYEEMVAQAEMLGYGEYFMGVGERRIRFTGHGVGLELDEFPFLAKGQQLPLEQGMVIALEPKVVITGQGVVGIENTHLVTAVGLEPLTTFDNLPTIV